MRSDLPLQYDDKGLIPAIIQDDDSGARHPFALSRPPQADESKGSVGCEGTGI